ncbi:MAG: gamma-glutamyl-gamma-aminobutyrate hydrolase family protein [Devosia sp.]|uniref:glutamine amidotransferase-related protein n=1 Tax=Devosia sp. TaxID=1871048 RepID=UPI0024CB3BFE|nr:gamma-glutamyl-gamma-aminobutyrate hydrolase family protein [Devosia sp.]UYN98113.1 MAG: gamma-glutamyl-gamma-aminobutyrate hydrolase family protein [Devosia sp.]
MKITILETGKVPEHLAGQFDSYIDMFQTMFEAGGGGFAYEGVDVWGGADLPRPEDVEAVAITGSPAGVYDDFAWLEPLRAFIRAVHAAGKPMLGICFGHQIIADALGGDVRKSEKGWGIGRHHYGVLARPDFMADAPEVLAIACSHQDQVIVAPPEATVILGSEFTPNAGLHYSNGRTLSFQGHPEFADDYAAALAEWRRGRIGEDVVETALSSFAAASDSPLVSQYIVRFFRQSAE